MTISENLIAQEASTGTAGFSFIGIRINGDAGSNTGSTYQDNSISSMSSGIQTTGLFANSPGTVNGTLIEDNNFDGLAAASGGAASTEMLGGGNVINQCLQPGPWFP